VNDLGGAVDGTGSGKTAQAVVDEIRQLGGGACVNTDLVTTQEGATAIIGTAMENYGRADILVNNAGILRDKTFANISIESFQEVLDVHLMGSVLVTKAASQIMRNWGRVVFTSSGSAMFGHFGQSNFASATVSRKRFHLVGEAESGQVTSLVQYGPGASFPAHPHPRSEEILVLSGIFSDETGDWPKGSYLLKPEGFTHAPYSKAGCRLLVKLGQY